MSNLVSLLPKAPSRERPATFAQEASNLLSSLSSFRAQLNAYNSEASGLSSRASALALALDFQGLLSLSTSTVSLSLGLKVFDVPAGKRYYVGQFLVADSEGGAMQLRVLSYSGTTLTARSLRVQGFGTFSSWQLSAGVETAEPASLQTLTGRNYLVNGDFGIYQTGVSALGRQANIDYDYDHWCIYNSTNTGAGHYHFMVDSGTYGSGKAMQFSRNTGQTLAFTATLAQVLESSQVKELQGRTVTLSFRVKFGAAPSAANLNFGLVCGTGTDQGVIALKAGTWTGQTSLMSSIATNGTDWQFASYTVTLPADALELAVVFNYTTVGTAIAGDNYMVTDVQLELGALATRFDRLSYTQQQLRCQRRFSVLPMRLAGCHSAASGIVLQDFVRYPTPLRVPPTLVSLRFSGQTTNGSYTFTHTNSYGGVLQLTQGASAGVFSVQDLVALKAYL